jgi:tetratricopeptide (TPR) repeat protein
MKAGSRSALRAGAVLSLVFCLATPVPAQKDEGAAPVAQADKAAALAEAADALLRAGNYSEASPLAQQVLAIREKQLGPDDPGVVYAINRLAGAYTGQGRYRDAEPLYRRALAIREKTLGPNDPRVAIALSPLGWVLNNLGDRDADAELVLGRAQAILQQAPGQYPPERLAFVLKNLGDVFSRNGNLPNSVASNSRRPSRS